MEAKLGYEDENGVWRWKKPKKRPASASGGSNSSNRRDFGGAGGGIEESALVYTQDFVQSGSVRRRYGLVDQREKMARMSLSLPSGVKGVDDADDVDDADYDDEHQGIGAGISGGDDEDGFRSGGGGGGGGLTLPPIGPGAMRR